jgi:hypothetical protein
MPKRKRVAAVAVPGLVLLILAFAAGLVLAPNSMALCTPKQWDADPVGCEEVFKQEIRANTPFNPYSSGPHSLSEITPADTAFMSHVLTYGEQQGFTIADGFQDLPTMRLGHNICGMIALQNMSPQMVDSSIWWKIPPSQGKYITKAAISTICPQYESLGYW